ncbi:MAG TPA: beta-galactosidase GalA [Paenibacillus sp.]|nr:beta-galactosidase GalA [Paenibacillus sp.]
MTQTDKGRRIASFDDGWTFYRGDIPIRYAVKAGSTGGITDVAGPEEGEWLDIAYADRNVANDPSAWEEVRLPHDWVVEGQYVNDPTLGTRAGSHGYLPTGVGVYRKTFAVPADELGRRITLHFDGVTGRSNVWVNGHWIGERFGGYTSFHYDISDVLRYGDEGENVVVVKVDARDHEGWWYEGGGIYRHVRLQSTDPLHVAHWGTYVTTPSIAADRATVVVRARIANEDASAREFELRTTIRRLPDGAIGAEGRMSATLRPGEETELEQSFGIEAPRLWSPETPHLYAASTEVVEGGDAVVDGVVTRFGVRSVAFDAERGFLLNGEPYPIKGTSNHQDFAGVGVALPDSLIAYKLKLLKEMGCNAYRSAHHPPTPELLDWCDEHGMLVMDENRKLDSSPRGLEELERMVRRDRNHPSVFLWSLENEEVLEGTVTGARILKSMAAAVRRLDPTRPITAAMNHGWNQGGYVAALDVVGYNYGHRGADQNGKRVDPNRRIVGSESASYTTTRGVYEDDPDRGYCSAYGTNIPSWGCSPGQSWADVLKYPFLSGVFLWTGFDYRGEPTPYEWPCISSHFGMLDTCGFPKDIYYLVKACWTEAPLVHLLPHWNWPGREGEPIRVVAYGNCERVELFLNGVSLGERSMIATEGTEWTVPYAPGVLRCVGYRGGEAVATSERATAGAPYAIRLEPDRTTFRADGADTVPVRAIVVDAAGVVVPTADAELRFAVEGPGRVLGVGNGDPSSHAPDKANRRRAFNGYALALVQSTGDAGGVTLRATADGLRAAVCELQALSRPTNGTANVPRT